MKGRYTPLNELLAGYAKCASTEAILEEQLTTRRGRRARQLGLAVAVGIALRDLQLELDLVTTSTRTATGAHRARQ
jgi:hypothetical protein